MVVLNAPHRVINAAGACLAGLDAICMAVLAVSVMEWEGTEHAERADKAVMIIQLMVLVGGFLVLVGGTVVCLYHIVSILPSNNVSYL